MFDKIAKKGRSPEAWKKHLKSKGAPQKYIDMISGIESSGKGQGKSKEYIMRTIIDKIPKKYIDEPTSKHGPGKSGPLSSSKKGSIDLNSEDHSLLDKILTKVAQDNGLENITKVSIALTENEGIIKFYTEK